MVVIVEPARGATERVAGSSTASPDPQLPSQVERDLGHLVEEPRSARRLVERLGPWRIRGGARLRDYHSYAGAMSASEYVVAVVHGFLIDRTLGFQLHEGFHVIAVVPQYLAEDPETLGFAAVVEWLNPS